MLEKIKIFEELRIGVLEDAVNEFLSNRAIVPIEIAHKVSSNGERATYSVLLYYQEFDASEISPKDKKGYEYRRHKK